MAKEKDKKDLLLLDAARLGQLDRLEAILSQNQLLKWRRKSNPLAR